MANLNPQQQVAVDHVQGPLLVLAGAGSGKTRVVTHRIAHLLDLGIAPSDILAVTFTNKAAEEMKTRIRGMKNVPILACTFHSLGARMLRESIHALGYTRDFTIYDSEDSDKLLKGALEHLNLSDAKKALKDLRHQISTAKNDLISPEDAEKKGEDRLFLEAYRLYQQKLKECNAVDFDDLLYLPVKLLREHELIRREYQNRWLFVLIDEYQDTNTAQYTLARFLVETHHNLFAVGDPDQSIYSWRGAKYQNILNFESDFAGAKVVTLDQNYRSTNHILRAANALICHNEKRFDKKLWSHLGDGSKIRIYIGQNEREEANFVAKRIFKHLADDLIPLTEMAIFYRTNAQSRPFEDTLLAHRIPYVIIGGLSFYERKEVKDLLAYLRLIASNADLISFLRIINLPKRGLGAAFVDKLVEAAGSTPIFTFCQDALSTLKLSAKQREGLQSFVTLIETLRNLATHLKIHELLLEVIERTRYTKYLEEDAETAQDRKENVNELIGKAAEWEQEHEEPTLQKFLEELALRTPSEHSDQVPTLKLMTIHNSKGLEFNAVFLVGLEEDLFPHINSKDSPSALEEERRLCYVGMTRAKKELYLTASIYRFMWGTSRMMRPSRFLKELPQEHLQNLSPSLFIPTRSY